MDTAVHTHVGYTEDEHAWLLEQAALLTAGRISKVDREHLGEYLTDMATRDRRELRSRLTVLLTHILKCTLQPDRVSRSCLLTVLTQQREVGEIIRASRSLEKIAAELLPSVVATAAEHASIETETFLVSVPPGIDLPFVLSYRPVLAPHPSSPTLD